MGWRDQLRVLFFKESPAPLPKDRTLAKANCIAVEWDKNMRELRKKKLLWKQQARDRGEETGSDDDDDDEVAANVDWDVLEDEDTLTDAHRSMHGTFPFHAEGSESVRSTEPVDPPPHPGCRRRIGGWEEADLPSPPRC